MASAAVVTVRIVRHALRIAMCARAVETALAIRIRKAVSNAQRIAGRAPVVVTGSVQAPRTARVANKIVASAPFAATVSVKMRNLNRA